MNEQIQNILNKSNLSIYEKQQQILSLICNFIDQTYSNIIITYTHKANLKYVYLQIQHYKYDKLKLYNNILYLYKKSRYEQYNITPDTVNLNDFNWQITLDILLAN